MITEEDITFDFILECHILAYRESGSRSLPSITEFFCQNSYPYQEEIATYLDKAQYSGLTHTGPRVRDYITGELLNNYGYPKTDGTYFEGNIILLSIR